MAEIGKIYPKRGTIRADGLEPIFFEEEISGFKNGDFVMFEISPKGIAVNIKPYTPPKGGPPIKQPPQRFAFTRDTRSRGW